jgi:valyl-tRNA synthetase
MDIATKYDPSQVEDKWYRYWMENGFFHSEPDEREPYTIVIPPPNVTGVLHMGHMLNNTIQDILVRRARMLGKNACWVPGTDHASIATEAKVVAKLAEQGIQKTDLSREQFLEHVWEWTHKHGGIILEQLKKLGASCDWERTCFTMDEKRSESVIKVFVDLYNQGLIYRGVRMVNWDPQAKTALSDEEVIHKEQKGKLYYLRYRIAGASPESASPHWAVIATTRPETIFGDTAVAIHPNDPKTRHLKGKTLIVPLVNREIPVIEDEYVDIEFGTGCLKVTPAHDINDYLLGEKHGLEAIDVFNDDGSLNAHGMQYEGLDRFAVRDRIALDLEAAGWMEKTEPYENKVGFSERTSVPIEPKLSMQWFLKMKPLAEPALQAVMDNTIRFYPAKFKNTYRHWMENIKDWNISRQLWWGHQIPAYYLPQGGFVVAETREEALLKAQSTVEYPLTIADLRQDEDTLDTWFSSWLWPLSVFDGINRPENPEIDYYYPTNDLVTAPEIIFFWVARMVMSGYQYRRQPCFRNVYFTGIVRDKVGRKMSKSLGNSPDPLALIKRYGADGVRMGMLLASPAGNDLPFDEALCEQGRNFNNKIWNAFRLIQSWEVASLPSPEPARAAVRWFAGRLSETIASVNDLFDKYRISEALMEVYKLFWDEFSAWYLEIIKPGFQQPVDPETARATTQFFDALLRLLHPFMPFITEELWQALEERNAGESIMIAPLPTALPPADRPASDVFKTIVAGVRTLRQQNSIPPKELLALQVVGDYDSADTPVILKLAYLSGIERVAEKTPGAVSFLVGATEFAVPVGNNRRPDDERRRLQAELDYQRGFLQTVLNKLNNKNFVAKAPAGIIETERKKQADVEHKIRSLEESIAALPIR